MIHSRRQAFAFPALLILILLIALPLSAQDSGVTDDDVNAVAKQMYCPVCENIPLDVCPTQACEDWRGEIRSQLEQGQSEQQIIDSFVVRYGERVIGTPQDPSLRALSLVTPWLVGLAAVMVALLTFVRWRGNQRQFKLTRTPALDGPPVVAASDEEYRARLERDLKQRR